MQKTEPYHKDCEHCHHNPKATKPFIPMKKLPLNNWKDIVRIAEADGKNPNCYVCEIVEIMINGFNRKN